MKNEHQSDAQAFILCELFKSMNKHKQTQRIMYLTDLTDAQKEYIKGTILYNPQNETCNAPKTKRAKNKTKRATITKRNVPSVRSLIEVQAPLHPALSSRRLKQIKGREPALVRALLSGVV